MLRGAPQADLGARGVRKYGAVCRTWYQVTGSDGTECALKNLELLPPARGEFSEQTIGGQCEV